MTALKGAKTENNLDIYKKNREELKIKVGETEKQIRVH